MPRFYFHLAGAGETFPDEEGCELSSLSAAHGHAMRLALKVLAMAPEDRDWRGWRVEVERDTEPVLTVLFPPPPADVRPHFGLRRLSR